MKNLFAVCLIVLSLIGCYYSYNPKSSVGTASLSPKRIVTTQKYSKNSNNCPSIGAIRWDAWYGDKDKIGKAEESVLGPKKWHYRLPFCAEITGPDAVKINCATPNAMDQEIAYAKQAGIDYWAFATYDSNLPLSLTLKNYLSSPKKSEINFSLITGHRKWTPESYIGSIEYFINYMREPSYQKVAGSRPLIYFFGFKDDWIKKNWKNDAAFKSVISKFRQRVKQSGHGNPYIVIMDFNPNRAKQLVDRFGFDAISTYAIPGNGGEAPHKYEMLATNAERYWDRAKTTGTFIVPTVMSGWDHRPRAENPVVDSWKEYSQRDKDKYYNPPMPKELGQHLENALSWVKTNSTQAQANTVIIYAWDEFSEGGWLAPTLSEGTAKLDAIGSVIHRDCPVKR